jgi:hypothetical protein
MLFLRNIPKNEVLFYRLQKEFNRENWEAGDI